ncbi:uncharacterized protein LOC123295616 isoform X2 [Chrysoperla carnea]|uniref:uncharacterized protein LOC123295616 isoform X2 n=1 Tax=Chrysoperla carnea TaxID=189513 RepID=UPI001D089E20|nr:uncharacterized protein LOC123295616 isoform X2 [Chrysoperla carnea]
MQVFSWLTSFTTFILLLYQVQGDGNIGCLFNENLCMEKVEWCYDDFLFGRCLQATVEPDDLYRFEYLTSQQLEIIENELRELLIWNYHWSHPYTQCLLQAILYAFKNNIPHDFNNCHRYIKQKDVELYAEDVNDPLAVVKFMPSLSDPSAPFADEIYYPPTIYDENDVENIQADGEEANFEDSNDVNDMDPYNLPAYNIEKKSAEYFDDGLEFLPAMHRRSSDVDDLGGLIPINGNELPIKYDFANENFRKRLLYYSDQNENEPYYEPSENLEPFETENLNNVLYKVLNEYPLPNQDNGQLLKSENLQNQRHILPNKLNFASRLESNNIEKPYQPDVIELIQKDMNAPRYSQSHIDEIPEPRIYYDDLEYTHPVEDEPGSGESHIPSKLYKKFDKIQSNQENEENSKQLNRILTGHLNEDENIPSGIYTEGGVVVMPSPKKSGTRELTHSWGFTRHERYDVKKPGPPFDDKTSEDDLKHRKHVDAEGKNGKKKKSLDGSFDADSLTHSLAHHHFKYEVDASYAYVNFKEGIRKWHEGLRIIEKLEKMLHLDEGTFTNNKVDTHQVTFKVEPNNLGMNASEVAEAIGNLKDKIKTEIGVEVTNVGIGYKTKQPLVWSSQWLDNADQEVFVSKLLIVCVLAALLMACVTLGIVWRHASSRQKIRDINSTVKDTEELCRSRMATKISTGTPPCPQTQVVEKAEGVHGRITSLSRESDQQSPSSRSSTSSWSEEPVLSNMDISTGHMVLSYMEDHLKNKDRLEQEWVALCAYEAEPCATTISQKKENIDKNRYPHVLPYDHSRVVLSSLTNFTESDYINASTITDHDPRNPAYIATQGPLPNTAADFWQMVWEQGSVVMVMLTRLTENGNAMCHRYWPEEGSEIYHIYEVHLVSEHIWCDDYLVRSFYLKNMKTGETRTVTQFHFLSWPELGVPTSTKALLEFRRKVNKSYRGRSCPIIVHCSDGAGRTGTYCLIDMVLNRMSKGAKEIDIAATLEHIRDQRPAMVTTKQQFEFVLMAVAEEVHAILKALPATVEKQ